MELSTQVLYSEEPDSNGKCASLTARLGATRVGYDSVQRVSFTIYHEGAFETVVLTNEDFETLMQELKVIEKIINE